MGKPRHLAPLQNIQDRKDRTIQNERRTMLSRRPWHPSWCLVSLHSWCISLAEVKFAEVKFDQLEACRVLCFVYTVCVHIKACVLAFFAGDKTLVLVPRSRK